MVFTSQEWKAQVEIPNYQDFLYLSLGLSHQLVFSYDKKTLVPLVTKKARNRIPLAFQLFNVHLIISEQTLTICLPYHMPKCHLSY